MIRYVIRWRCFLFAPIIILCHYNRCSVNIRIIIRSLLVADFVKSGNFIKIMLGTGLGNLEIMRYYPFIIQFDSIQFISILLRQFAVKALSVTRNQIIQK